ncbi:E2 domain-containing protein [Roseicella sp. DB1501]|uniref:E2 domain-containing protein n=1 Tax=Roseicella sp. DB1501 TaxID=2730925 RepID=UPI0014923852|nr:E2 domain-containing protein [Roseicella sp. DB1501]NOG73612.1 hypothetical protein [Roseicella sp. DB1501]
MSDVQVSATPGVSHLVGLDAIIAVADDFGAVVAERRPGAAVAVVSPHVHGGGRDDFRLIIGEEGGRVSVREDPAARRLPAACPTRHINPGGTFCLGWDTEDPSAVTDVAGAREWWTTLLVFLGYQRYAEVRRAWPKGRERAHGHDAALLQFYAEWLASLFGPWLLADLRAGRLTTRRVGRSIRLDRARQRLFALKDGSESVANLRRSCPCTTAVTPAVLKACGSHAQAARLLVLALSGQEQLEAEFHKAFARAAPCCGTIDGCPIASIVSPALDGSPSGP